MLNIITGKQKRPQRVVIYGGEGLGKTTLVAQIPDVLVIDTEDGTAQHDIRRIPKPQSWQELLNIIHEVAVTPGVCKTLAIDSIDWAEQLCVAFVLEKYRQASIESFGYGKGYTYLSDEFMNLLRACDEVIDAGINVVFTAHAKMRKFEQPDEEGAYDRWEMKLSKNVSPLVKEWCDALLFMNYKTYVVSTENNTKKAKGGERVIYTSHHPCWDAKNRHGLPEELPLIYDSISLFFEESTKKEQLSETTSENKENEYVNEIRKRLDGTGITETALKELVAKKGYYTTDVPLEDYSDEVLNGWILKNWTKIVDMLTPKN